MEGRVHLMKEEGPGSELGSVSIHQQQRRPGIDEGHGRVQGYEENHEKERERAGRRLYHTDLPHTQLCPTNGIKWI